MAEALSFAPILQYKNIRTDHFLPQSDYLEGRKWSVLRKKRCENLKIAVGNRAGIRENRAISGQNVGEDWGRNGKIRASGLLNRGNPMAVCPNFGRQGDAKGFPQSVKKC